jgi:hypothetical protein
MKGEDATIWKNMVVAYFKVLSYIVRIDGNPLESVCMFLYVYMYSGLAF